MLQKNESFSLNPVCLLHVKASHESQVLSVDADVYWICHPKHIETQCNGAKILL